MELSELTDKAIDYMLPELISQENRKKLSPWEWSFIESITDQWERRRKLSDRQKEILGSIWDKV